MDQPSVSASSADGRQFGFNGLGAEVLRPGDVAVVSVGPARILGQVTAAARGSGDGCGQVLGALSDRGLDRDHRAPFTSSEIAPAGPAELRLLQTSSDAGLPVGTWVSGGTRVEALLRAQGFGRHTFLCGQSGSGKTYALGVILEQVRLHTGLRIVVLDPNADYVRMNEVRPGVPGDAAQAWRALGPVAVLGSDASGAEPLRLRFDAMPRAAQAAVLRLDPLRDRGEYHLFVRRAGDSAGTSLSAVVAELSEGTADEQALAQRIENLGLLDWEAWALDQASAAEVVDVGESMTVLDLNGFKDPHESTAVCLALVEHLWARRADRTPTLLVLDEAHHLCPADPSGTLQEALVDRLVQIAAEGRKYGIWLLLSTQRPSKLHPQVLSQCDNLVLMRMNSRADLSELATVFGSVPLEMLDASPAFTQGQALLAGPLVPVPTLLRMGDRITVEGGSDVRVPDRT